MRETNFEPFTKMLVVALCALLICGEVCVVTTASEDDALVGGGYHNHRLKVPAVHLQYRQR